MSRIQNGKNRNPEKPVSGCLGRMVNLFDLNINVGGNKLLTDKPHHDGSAYSRRQSDVSSSSLVDNQMDDKMMVSGLKKFPSNKKSNGTPIKMLIAQEMSKKEDCKQSPSNLVAKLMGLDGLPPDRQPGSAQKQKMDLVREKFMEAKRLSSDEKLRQSMQFQDALEVLNSNKDMFLKFLQDPNSLFSQNVYNLQSVPPPPDSRRITVLRSSKINDSGNKNEKQVKEIVQMGRHKSWDKKSSDFLFSPKCCKTDEYPSTQPTRIVVLKPSSVKPHNIKVVASHDDEFDAEDREVTEEIVNDISDNLSALRGDETILSSVFSNGYIGEDSSYCKSEIDYSEVVSPTSRHSWDYINRFNSHYRASSSRTSYSPESSVCREAKKRLSERWAVMASNKNVQEHKEIQRSSSTLGDMLALSNLKKSVKSEEKKDIDLNKNADNHTSNSPRSLLRSKSVPASVTLSDDKKSLSFKGRVSSLFFPKNKKSRKENSQQSPRNDGNEGSQCINDMVTEEASCSGLKKGIVLPEAGFSFTKPGFSGNNIENQDQPSPISVLEPPFEEDDPPTNCRRISKLNGNGIEPMKYNLIDKSPPIGSIARTLSWNDSVRSSTPYFDKPSSTPLNPEEEEQECSFYVQTLLSLSGHTKIHPNSFLPKWHSPESPLDPSLEPILFQTKQKHPRPITKLVFDCVNEALIDISTRGPYTLGHNSVDDMAMSSTVLLDRVWARMKEWISGDERCDWDDGDGGGAVVEWVVNKEVVGKGWVEGLILESDDTRKEIEERLLDELVHECVLELTCKD